MSEHREAGFVATLIGIPAILLSFGVALLLNLGTNPPVGQVTGAAWAWTIGVASERYWIPFVKQAIPSVEGGEA